MRNFWEDFLLIPTQSFLLCLQHYAHLFPSHLSYINEMPICSFVRKKCKTKAWRNIFFNFMGENISLYIKYLSFYFIIFFFFFINKFFMKNNFIEFKLHYPYRYISVAGGDFSARGCCPKNRLLFFFNFISFFGPFC